MLFVGQMVAREGIEPPSQPYEGRKEPLLHRA